MTTSAEPTLDDLTMLTDIELDAVLHTSLRDHGAGGAAARAECHAVTMAVLAEQGRRLDVWLAGLDLPVPDSLV